MSLGDLIIVTAFNLMILEGLYMEYTNVRFARDMAKMKIVDGFSTTMMKRDIAIEVVRLVGLSFFLFIGLLAYFTPRASTDTPQTVSGWIIEIGLILGAASLVINANIMHVGNQRLRAEVNANGAG